MIDPDAVYTLTECATLTGRSYHQVTNAVQRGRLVATRTQGPSYQVRGADLIAWRDRVPHPHEFAEPVYRPLPSQASLVSPPTLTAEGIRTLRTRLGLTQKQFAHLLGYAPGTVVRWETGHHAPGKRARMALRKVFSRRIRQRPMPPP